MVPETEANCATSRPSFVPLSPSEWRGMSLDNSNRRQKDSFSDKFSFKDDIVMQPKASTKNMQILKNAKKMLDKMSFGKFEGLVPYRNYKPSKKIGSNYCLKNVCSCTTLNEGYGKSPSKTPCDESGVQIIRGPKNIRKIFTPQNEAVTCPVSTAHTTQNSATKRRVIPNNRAGCKVMKVPSINDKIYGKVKLIAENCSASTATNNSAKQERKGDKILADFLATSEEEKQDPSNQLKSLKIKVMCVLERYKKREALIINENKKLKTENIKVKQKLHQYENE